MPLPLEHPTPACHDTVHKLNKRGGEALLHRKWGKRLRKLGLACHASGAAYVGRERCASLELAYTILKTVIQGGDCIRREKNAQEARPTNESRL